MDGGYRGADVGSREFETLPFPPPHLRTIPCEDHTEAKVAELIIELRLLTHRIIAGKTCRPLSGETARDQVLPSLYYLVRSVS